MTLIVIHDIIYLITNHLSCQQGPHVKKNFIFLLFFSINPVCAVTEIINDTLEDRMLIIWYDKDDNNALWLGAAETYVIEESIIAMEVEKIRPGQESEWLEVQNFGQSINIQDVINPPPAADGSN